MKHNAHSVIKSYLRHTSNQTFLHIILLLLEHIPLIITSMNAPLKLKYFFSNDITTPLHNSYYHPILNFFPFRCPNPSITSISTLTFFILLSFFLVFYHLFISIHTSPFQFIFTNFYDLLYFRYGSFYPISIYFTLIFSTNDHSHYVPITIVTLFILLWYLFETYIHISSTFTLIRITNQQLCQHSLAYPFDYFVSTKASVFTLALKVFVSAEYVLYTSRNQHIDIIQLGLNMVIIVLFFIEVITVVYLFVFNISVKYLLNDNLLNLVRMCFVLFTFFNIVLFMLFINHNSQHVFICVVSVIALFWGVCVTCYIWYKRAKPLLMDGVFTQDKILYALLNGDGVVKNGKSKVRMCSVPALKIVNSMQYYHFTHCGENPSVCKVCKLFNEETQQMKEGSNDDVNMNMNVNTSGNVVKAHLVKYEQMIKIYKVLFRNQKWKIFQQQRHKKKDKRNNASQLFNNNNTNSKSAIKDEHTHKDIFYQFNLYLLLLTYFIKKKDFKFLFLYKYSISRIRKDLVPHLNVFCEFFMEQNSSPENNIFFYIHATSTVNKDLTDTLVLINDFISLPNEMKYFSHFFKLSQSLKKLSDDLLSLITETESNTDNNIHHKTKKLIISIHKYNLILNRFVVEKLLNKVFIMLSYFDIESLEDIIQLHYSKDKFLMLGMDFKNDPGELIGSKFKVIKCGKEMITYKSHDLLDMFPKIFQIAGLQTFLKLLKKYDQSEMEFDFLYKSSLTSEVEYLKYLFKVSPNLVDHYLFIYGFYINDYKRVMAVLEQDDNDYSLVTISHDMKAVLFLETEWLDVLAMNQKYILLSQIFRTFIKLDEDNNTNSYEGILDYKYYISNMKQYLKVIVEYYEQNNKSKELLNKTVEKLHSRSNLSVKFKFSFLFDIKQGKNRKCKIFSISLSNRHTTQGKDLFDTFHLEDSSIKRDTKSETNQYVKKYETAVNSVSSQTLTRGNSQSGGSSLKGRLGAMMNFISDEQNAVNDNKLRKIQKIFSIFSLVIIVLNVVIILLCIVFLVVAITSAHRLTTINKLYFKFKDVRIFFNHNFLTIFANACICPSIECNDKCYINFNRFWEKLSTKYELDSSLHLRTYLLAELEPKVDSLQTTFEEFLQDIYSLNDDKLLTTVTNTLEYKIMNIVNNKIETNEIYISFNEGIKRIIASMTALAYDQNESFNRPIAILNYTTTGNYFLSLSESYIQTITDIEKDLYSLVSNYIHYSFAYEKGELEIENAYRQLSKRTKQILISFMIAIIICNILLCCFCCFYIFIVKEFLINFILRILTILQNQDFLKFYKEKIDNLLIITRLYEKNPNDLIKQIKKIELVQLKQLKANIANKKKMAIRSKRTIDKNELSTPLALDNNHDNGSSNNNNNNNSSSHNVSTALLFNSSSAHEQQQNRNNNNSEFTNTTLSDLTSISTANNQSTDPSACGNDIVNVLRPFYIKIALLFTLYAVFAVIFDLVLVTIYEQYLLVNDYAIENSKIANQIFANLVLIELSILINITKSDFHYFFGSNSYSEDGYINQKIRSVYSQIFHNKHIQQNNPSIIANTQKFFDYNCETLFTQINDSITHQVSANTHVNYDKLFASLCDYYHILSLGDFDYLFNSLNQMTQEVANGINKRTYEDLYRIHNEHNLEELYVLMLGLFRPIQLYLREKIINKKLFDTVDLFLGLVWSYLCFNIVVDVVMFIYLKIYIINQLIDMNHNLNLLSGCFYDLH